MPVPQPRLPGRFHVERLFRPASVVVVGAATTCGRHVLANLHDGGFAGPILTADDAATIGTLPSAPDLALVCLDGAAVGEAFAALGRRGTRAAIVLGMAQDIGALARQTGVRAFGPGSFGLVVPGIGLNAGRGHIKPRPGRLALVSQSASLCRAVLDWAEPNGVGFSHIVGIGGNADLGFAAVLDWLSRDPGTGAILLDLRRIKDARRFLSAARAAARLRPVVAIRPGGRLLDPTGAADATLQAGLHRSGVLTVTQLAELLAAAETLTRAKPLRGEALAIATNAIGPAWLAADAVLREGLTLATLTTETRTALRIALPEEMHTRLHRPDARAATDLIYAGSDTPIRLAEAASLLAGAPEVSGVLLVHAPTGPADAAGMEAIAAAASAMRVPLLVAAMGETTGAVHRTRLAGAGVPTFATPEQAVRGFLHLVRDRRSRAAARELPPSTVLEIAPDRAAATAILAAARAAGRTALTSEEALAVLAAYGVASGPAESGSAAPLSVRVGEDAAFGPTITLAQGATAALDLPPLNLPLAHALTGRVLRTDDARRAAVADTLVRVSQLAVDFPQIAELFLDPLHAGPAGAAVERAGLRLRSPGAVPPQLAIAPYPAELAGHFSGRRETFLIRPIRPEDAAAHAAFFARLPPQDVRFRFFSALRELPAEQIARLTQVDYDREIAFVAVREATRETVGVARLVQDAADSAGEFAIVVQPDVKGQGLARHLMQRLFDWARVRGVTEIVGMVLAENAPMLGFVRHLGFVLQRVPDDETVVEARLVLADADAGSTAGPPPE